MATKRVARPHRKAKKTVVTTKIANDAPIDVSVIILNFNTKQLTVDCIQSILASDTDNRCHYEIIVVDNGSTDGSAAHIKKIFANKVRVITAERNLGFGPGNNLGASEARGDYVFFINSDTLLQPATLLALFDAAERETEYGMLAPRVVLEDGKTVQPASFGNKATTWHLLTRSVDLPARYLDRFTGVAPVAWVTGAAFIMPTTLFLAMGGFDTRYFMYWEDQDLCRTVTSYNWKIGVVVDATIIHLGGRSHALAKNRYTQYDRSQRSFLLKHEGIIATVFFLALTWPWKLWRNAHATKSTPTPQPIHTTPTQPRSKRSGTASRRGTKARRK